MSDGTRGLNENGDTDLCSGKKIANHAICREAHARSAREPATSVNGTSRGNQESHPHPIRISPSESSRTKAEGKKKQGGGRREEGRKGGGRKGGGRKGGGRKGGGITTGDRPETGHVVFHVGTSEHVLFPGWYTGDSLIGFILSCLFFFLMALTFEALKHYSLKLTRDGVWGTVSGTTCYVIQVSLGYLLMIGFMYLNLWFCLSILAGTALGNLFLRLACDKPSLSRDKPSLSIGVCDCK
ncbi:unnamed protein product [Darwinula stevensoni]|uniref:Copper transport protein n=1 Tax=Darwinula stevensoni TaxID=69355 RepID=A0A7R9ABR9_9CRUS|nr:unnamed protein product [Darwinula stevensoni]CAG0899124.1 unnamed protein product [Darwinula stevensoni]